MIAADPDFEAKVRAGFAAQRVMATFRAELTSVVPGEVVIELPFGKELTQQDGFLHAGVVTTMVDSACGFAAFSLMPAGARVLSVEFKVNLLRPAAGERFRAVARVIKPGRRLMVCQGDVHALTPDGERHVATMTATMICIEA